MFAGVNVFQHSIVVSLMKLATLITERSLRESLIFRATSRSAGRAMTSKRAVLAVNLSKFNNDWQEIKRQKSGITLMITRRSALESIRNGSDHLHHRLRETSPCSADPTAARDHRARRALFCRIWAFFSQICFKRVYQG